MLRELKMSLYRLIRSKSFYICFIVIGAFIGLCCVSYGQAISDDKSLVDITLSFFSSGLFQLVMLISVAIFLCLDYSSGYIKNVASSVASKVSIFINSLLVGIIISVIYMILTVICLYFGLIIFSGVSTIGSLSTLLLYVGQIELAYIALIALTCAAVSFFRSSAACITFIVVVTQFIGLIYLGIKSLIDFDMLEYSFIYGVNNLQLDKVFSANVFMTMSICFIACCILGGIAMKKVDIK